MRPRDSAGVRRPALSFVLINYYFLLPHAAYVLHNPMNETLAQSAAFLDRVTQWRHPVTKAEEDYYPNSRLLVAHRCFNTSLHLGALSMFGWCFNLRPRSLKHFLSPASLSAYRR